MGDVASYLDCGCAIMTNGSMVRCPTCESTPARTPPAASQAAMPAEQRARQLRIVSPRVVEMPDGSWYTRDQIRGAEARDGELGMGPRLIVHGPGDRIRVFWFDRLEDCQARARELRAAVEAP